MSLSAFKKTAVGIVSAGLVIGALTGCSQSNTGASPSSSSGTGTSASAPASTPSTAPTPALQVKDLKGEKTEVVLDKGFTDALTSLKLTPGTTGTAKLDADTGTLSFPITGGNVTYYGYKVNAPGGYVQGEIDHDGSGISLKGGDTTVQLRNFQVFPGSGSHLNGDVYVNGKLAAENATIFDLDGSTLQEPTVKDNGQVVLYGTRVLISETAAGLLNQTFKTDAVKGGLLVGVARITADTK